MKNYSLFFFSYLLILLISQNIFLDYFNTYHVDHVYYFDEVLKYKEIYNYLEILIKIFSFSPDINLPIIFFFTLFYKIFETPFVVLIVNAFFTLCIFIKINKILLSFDFKKIFILEFLILISFITYLNIGINKEVITILIFLHILHELIRIAQDKINNTNLVKLIIFIILFSLIKPLHSVFLISLLFFCLVFIYLIKRSQNLLIVIFIFTILIITLANLINLRYADHIPYFNFINSYQYINENRNTFFLIALTHPTLEYLNRSDQIVLFEGFLFNLHNLSLISKGFISSITFPTFNDMIYGIKQPSRFILFIIFDSLLIKIGICYTFYCLFKKKNISSNLILIIFMIFFSLLISINVANDGMNYRYLYPYKFIFIFLGYCQVKLIFKKFMVASGGLEPPRE